MSAPLPPFSLSTIELWQVFPGAPRRWSEMPCRFTTPYHAREWGEDASAVLGYAVTLDCGDHDEVWVVRASSMPPDDQEQTP